MGYGLGMYTHTEITWDEDSTFSISNLAAGSELGDVDTSALSTPYNPAQAEPVHAIWVYNQSTYDKTFYTSMNGAPSSLSVSCIAGRDGYSLDEDFGEMEVDNSDCDSFIATTTLSSSNLMKQGFPVKVNSVTHLTIWVLCCGQHSPWRRCSECGHFAERDCRRWQTANLWHRRRGTRFCRNFNNL